jgi:hypothetical protein
MRNRRTLTALDIAALTLATIGAINWGLSGAANLNLVRRIFGRGSILERAVYVVVGLAGLDLAWLTARFISGGYQTPPPVTQYQPSETMRQFGQQAGEAAQKAQRGVQEAKETAQRGFEQATQPTPYQPYPPSRP